MFSKLEIKFKIFINSRTDQSAVVYSHDGILKSNENEHIILVPNMDEFHKCKILFSKRHQIQKQKETEDHLIWLHLYNVQKQKN